MYFGLLTKEGELVTEDEFNRFLEEYINPYYDGYTVVSNTIGIWKKQVEPSKMIIIIDQNSGNTNTINYNTKEHIKFICETYCSRFKNDCVMVSYQDVEMELYGRNK